MKITKVKLEQGMIIKLRRIPTNENNAIVVFRTVKSIEYKKKTINCDDGISYKFKNLI